MVQALIAALHEQDNSGSWVLSYASTNIFFDRKPDLVYDRKYFQGNMFEEICFETENVNVQYTVHRGNSINGPQIFIHK